MNFQTSITPQTGLHDPQFLLGHPAVQQAVGENVVAALILDEALNVVAANHTLLSERGLPHLDELVSVQPGDLLGCRHADVPNHACGTSEHCAQCEVRDAVRRAFEQGAGRAVSLHEALDPKQDAPRKVTAHAFVEGGRRYVVMVVQDLSAEVHREEMLHTFLHDLNNVVGSLRNLEQLSDLYRHDPTALCRFVKRQALVLEEEIAAQQVISQMADDSLEVRLQTVRLTRLAETAIETVSAYPQAAKKSFILAPTLVDVLTRSDPVLVRRILINLLKNAVEASDRQAHIRLRLDYAGDWVEASVHNPEPIPPEQQTGIFKRSQSNKGPARGLGCWSAKLLSESYLDGVLSFSSSVDAGTTFTLRLPVTRNGLTRSPFGNS
ncbi:MAG: sensor histidine kinase [Opitutales bacterium]